MSQSATSEGGTGASGAITGAVFVDTNVLLRWLDSSHPLHATAQSAIEAIEAAGGVPTITAQSVIEWWAVATRPTESNGFGWDAAKSATAKALLLASFDFVPDVPDIFAHWQRLVSAHGVMGLQVHDTRLAAVMLAHGIGAIVTFNARHFRRFQVEGIQVLDPQVLAAGSE